MVFVLRQTGSLQKSEGVQSTVSCGGKASELVGNSSSNDQLNLRTELVLDLEVNMQQICNMFHSSSDSCQNPQNLARIQEFWRNGQEWDRNGQELAGIDRNRIGIEVVVAIIRCIVLIMHHRGIVNGTNM